MATDHGADRRTYAIITPSYAPDFERCRVLVESVRRYAAPYVEHYLIVDRRDLKLFSRLSGPRTHVVLKQEILPRWLRQVPLSSKWWLSLKGQIVRGWIIQQIVKLSVDAVTCADVCVFIDSDAFLIKPFDPRAAERAGQVPMFREVLPRENAFNRAWLGAASSLLGLPPDRDGRTNYVSQAVTWRRANVIALHRYIEEQTGRGWVEALCPLRTMSEYVLYGVYCQRVLGERAGHYWDDTITTLNHWEEERLDDAGLSRLRSALRPEHIGVMISAKSNTDVPAIRRAFDLAS
jgi:hypothetical protein